MKQEYLSEADRKDIIFGIENDVDFFACSFVSCKQDLLDVKKVLSEHGGEKIDIIAKIENRSGVMNIKEICEECGKPFDAGFIGGDGDWYCCGSCFDDAMDKTYGEGKWRPTDEEGEYGGFYENFDGDEWVDTSIYYTEWY